MFRNPSERAFSVRLGERIRSSRERKNISIEELAAGMLPPRKPRHIRQIETGDINASSFELNRIANILDVPICYLVGSDTLSNWIDDEQFINAYFQLSREARIKVRQIVLHLNGDNPIIYE